MSASTLQILKMAHVALALLSASGFVLRGAFIALGRRDLLRLHWVRVAPHGVDSLLLAAGVALAVAYGISPLAHPWFAAKLSMLLAYIVTGGLAIRRARAGNASWPWLVLALVCLAMIFASALTRRPLGLPWI